MTSSSPRGNPDKEVTVDFNLDDPGVIPEDKKQLCMVCFTRKPRTMFADNSDTCEDCL